MQLKYLPLYTVIVLLLINPCDAQDDKSTINIAVLNFQNRSESGQWQWLSKGLADMIITDLSSSQKLIVIERERLNEIVAELKLAETGIFDSSAADKVGQIAKADWVLFGSFLIEKDNLKIEAHILDLKAEELIRIEWVEGASDEILHLEKQLVEQLLKRLDIPVTEQEKRSIMYVPTDSLSAFEHYCRSLDFYDNGLWFDALLECRMAIQQDSDYIQTRTRVAELYYEIDKPEHALVEYQELVKSDKENTFPENIYYKMARLIEDKFNDDNSALVLYNKILSRHPEYNVPYDVSKQILKSKEWIDRAQYYSLISLERMALIQNKNNKSFEAAQLFSKIVYYMRSYTFSSAPPWGDFHDRVWSKYTPLYWKSVRENKNTILCPPDDINYIPQSGIINISSNTKKDGSRVSYRENIYCIAPANKEIAEIQFNIDTDAVLKRENGPKLSILVNCYEPVINANSQSNRLDGDNGLQNFEFKIKPGIRGLNIQVQYTSKWEISIKCRDWTKGVESKVQGEVYVRLNRQWDEIILDNEHNFKVSHFYKRDGSPINTYKAQPVAILHPYSGDHILQIKWPDGRNETKEFHVEPRGMVELFFENSNTDESFIYEFSRQGSNLKLFNDNDNKFWLLWDEAYKNGLTSLLDHESNLFYTTSSDGKKWSKPSKLQLSSSSLDMKPILQQDRSGTYWLAWISSRDSKDPMRLWIASSEDGEKWTFPRKINLPVTQHDIEMTRQMNYPSFVFVIDEQDTFWLIWLEKLFYSSDAIEWTEAEELSLDNGLSLQPGWSGFGEYYLDCDNSNHLVLVAKHEEEIVLDSGNTLGGKVALWSRNNTAKWEFPGFVDDGYIRSFSFCADGDYITVLADKGNDGLLLRIYDNTSGWSEFKRIDNAPDSTSNNSIISIGKKKYIVAYHGKKGIVVHSIILSNR